MGNEPTGIFTRLFPLLFGKDERPFPGSNATNIHPPATTVQPVTKCTNLCLECALIDDLLGFRNGPADTLQKPFLNFWKKFIPETGTSLWKFEKGLTGWGQNPNSGEIG